MSTLALALVACTDASLYDREGEAVLADRVTVAGRVCSEDPLAAELPVRFVLVVDRAAGPLFGSYDPAGERVRTLSAFVQSALTDDDAAFAVIGYAGRAVRLAPREGAFTRDPGELLAAITQLGLPEPCLDGARCRDTLDALRSARAVIEADVATLDAGERVVTQYVVVLVTSGPQSPLLSQVDCCALEDARCRGQTPMPSAACQAQREAEEVGRALGVVSEAGAIGVRLHVLHLAADVAGASDARATLEPLAALTRGTYQRFDAISGLGASALSVLETRDSLSPKTLYLANVATVPRPTGPIADSDQDGLADEEEARGGTSPSARDTDGDGIGDRVEILVGLDPLALDEPTACRLVEAAADRDLDGLSDCDEQLLGTEPTLVDSDGDGMPDSLELVAGIDYLDDDSRADPDGDGVRNADELQAWTDPRSTDGSAQLSFGVRAELVDEGVVREVAALRPTGLRRTTLIPSASTTPGIGLLRWDPATRSLTWQDGGDEAAGAPVEVPLSADDERVELVLPSSSAVGDPESDRTLTAVVSVGDMPDEPHTEQVRVVVLERHCLGYTFRNVRLAATRALDDGTPEGTNRLVLFFAESAAGRDSDPGPYRLAEIPILFFPPDAREPRGAVIRVREEEFVRAR